jgi:hypothetical protein
MADRYGHPTLALAPSAGSGSRRARSTMTPSSARPASCCARSAPMSFDSAPPEDASRAPVENPLPWALSVASGRGAEPGPVVETGGGRWSGWSSGRRCGGCASCSGSRSRRSRAGRAWIAARCAARCGRGGRRGTGGRRCVQGGGRSAQRRLEDESAVGPGFEPDALDGPCLTGARVVMLATCRIDVTGPCATARRLLSS